MVKRGKSFWRSTFIVELVGMGLACGGMVLLDVQGLKGGVFALMIAVGGGLIFEAQRAKERLRREYFESRDPKLFGGEERKR